MRDMSHLWGIGIAVPANMAKDDQQQLLKDRVLFGCWAWRVNEDGSTERVDPRDLEIAA